MTMLNMHYMVYNVHWGKAIQIELTQFVYNGVDLIDFYIFEVFCNTGLMKTQRDEVFSNKFFRVLCSHDGFLLNCSKCLL